MIITEFLEKSWNHTAHDQPTAIKNTLLWLEENIKNIDISPDNINRVFLVGCGDSYFVALFGMYLFEKILKISSLAENAYEFLTYRKSIGKNDLVMAISASGRTSKTYSAAKYAKSKQAKVIALTNFENSPLAKISDHKLLTRVKNPFGPPTTTSTTALIALLYFTDYLSLSSTNIIKTLEAMPSNLKKFIDDVMDDIDTLSKLIAKHNRIYFIGAGPNYSTALFGMAKFREVAWYHSIAFEAEEFVHYGMISIGKDDIIVLIANDIDSYKKIKEINNALHQIGSSNIIITNNREIFEQNHIISLPEKDCFVSQIYSLIFLQLLALKTAMVKNLSVNNFRYGELLSKLIGYIEK